MDSEEDDDDDVKETDDPPTNAKQGNNDDDDEEEEIDELESTDVEDDDSDYELVAVVMKDEKMQSKQGTSNLVPSASINTSESSGPELHESPLKSTKCPTYPRPRPLLSPEAQRKRKEAEVAARQEDIQNQDTAMQGLEANDTIQDIRAGDLHLARDDIDDSQQYSQSALNGNIESSKPNKSNEHDVVDVEMASEEANTAEALPFYTSMDAIVSESDFSLNSQSSSVPVTPDSEEKEEIDQIDMGKVVEEEVQREGHGIDEMHSMGQPFKALQGHDVVLPISMPDAIRQEEVNGVEQLKRFMLGLQGKDAIELNAQIPTELELVSSNKDDLLCRLDQEQQTPLYWRVPTILGNLYGFHFEYDFEKYGFCRLDERVSEDYTELDSWELHDPAETSEHFVFPLSGQREATVEVNQVMEEEEEDLIETESRDNFRSSSPLSPASSQFSTSPSEEGRSSISTEVMPPPTQGNNAISTPIYEPQKILYDSTKPFYTHPDLECLNFLPLYKDHTFQWIYIDRSMEGCQYVTFIQHYPYDFA